LRRARAQLKPIANRRKLSRRRRRLFTKNFHFDAGIVISASHNPYQDNGIKIFLPTGKKIDDLAEREIEKDIYGLNIEKEILVDPARRTFAPKIIRKVMQITSPMNSKRSI
jgi:phosphomannomutase